jgi:hypothetical protein
MSHENVAAAQDTAALPIDSSVVHRSFGRTVGLVGTQVLVGMMGGFAGALLAKIHPVAGGIGWIVGSSFGVYSVANDGRGEGSYWWTIAAGTGVVLAFTPSIAEGGDIAGAYAAAVAMLVSLAAEIVAYHISESPPQPHVSVSVSPCFGGTPFLSGQMGGHIQMAMDSRVQLRITF